MLRSRERESLFRARYACLSKVVVFCGNFVAPVRGMKRGKLLLLRSREGESLFRARYARLSKVVVFCGTFGCTSKGYEERETSLASLEREGALFQGSLCSPLKSGGFGCKSICVGW